MIEASDLPVHFALATAGEIAAINLESARQQSWSKFWHAPQRPEIAESIVNQEQMATQFLGDTDALDRLEMLANQLGRVDPESAGTTLIHAQVAATAHRFIEAMDSLTLAEARGAPALAIRRVSLSVDQACGKQLDAVLEERRRMAADSGNLADLVPLGALLADLGEFDEADQVYLQALREYADVSPFAMAWVCFQLGVLWGEAVPEPQSKRAAQWYQKAIAYLPCYVKARVHLSEIYSSEGRMEDAEDLLSGALATRDPEVSWRLADVFSATGRFDDAEAQMQVAHSGFKILLDKHLLAFADHGAEFYSGSGADPQRAFDLARLNLNNRRTLKAFEQAHATALAAGNVEAAAEFIVNAHKLWASTTAFRFSPLALRVAATEANGEERDAENLMTHTRRGEQRNAGT
jgi:tetratricopeptide (TPR) repeat protein